MSKNNDVFQVLVTKGNQAPLTIGNPISALADGQIGVFSYKDNLSITAASNAADKREFYIAVGIDRDADGTIDDIQKSSGVIQARNIVAYTARCYEPAQPKIIDITDFTVKCDTDYAIKVGIKNQKAYANYGFNYPYKTFVVHSNCCTQECGGCPESNCNDLVKSFVNEINADIEKIFTASFIDYTTTPGTPIVIAPAAVDAWVADPANVDKCLGIRLTGSPIALYNYCKTNLKYEFPRSTDLTVHLVEGFDCNGTATTVQELAYEEGAGYDIAQLEYEAGGWNGKPGPYRQSELVGESIGNFETFAVKTGKYVQINITSDQESTSGFRDYKNRINTTIAVPCGETTTLATLLAILDSAVTSTFGPLADDIADCPSCSTVESTSAKDNRLLDGL